MVFDILNNHQLKLLELFFKNNVNYLIVGGFAVRYYGYERYTIDLDVLIEIEPRNVEKICNILNLLNDKVCGIPLNAEQLEQIKFLLSKPDSKVVWMSDVDILASMKGLKFKELFKNKVIVNVMDIEIMMISKNDLIKSKQLALADQGRIQKKDVDEDDLLNLLNEEKFEYL